VRYQWVLQIWTRKRYGIFAKLTLIGALAVPTRFPKLPTEGRPRTGYSQMPMTPLF